MKTLVLFVFHEYNNRVKYFIENAIFKGPYVKFLIIWNCDGGAPPDVIIPKYVDVLFRKNIGYDFGGWSHGLFHNNNYKKYDSYLFVNSSVYGPFLKEGEPRNKWVWKYINGLTNDIKLFGSTINSMGASHLAHVQSYIFCVNKETLWFLINQHIFSLTNMSNTFLDAIYNKEVRMSTLIINNGWNIGCQHKLYKNVDFRNVKPRQKLRFKDDIMYPEYINTQPASIFEELVFVKGNRLGLP
jgi:lipopolysaccharide biosynthesis protein